MTRRRDPERLYIAARMGVASRLRASGLLEEAAERWIAAWEAEARSLGLDARTGAWWEPAFDWIAERRVRPVRPKR